MMFDVCASWAKNQKKWWEYYRDVHRSEASRLHQLLRGCDTPLGHEQPVHGILHHGLAVSSSISADTSHGLASQSSREQHQRRGRGRDGGNECDAPPSAPATLAPSVLQGPVGQSSSSPAQNQARQAHTHKLLPCDSHCGFPAGIVKPSGYPSSEAPKCRAFCTSAPTSANK